MSRIEIGACAPVELTANFINSLHLQLSNGNVALAWQLSLCKTMNWSFLPITLRSALLKLYDVRFFRNIDSFKNAFVFSGVDVFYKD